jgi:hypothetical protein
MEGRRRRPGCAEVEGTAGGWYDGRGEQGRSWGHSFPLCLGRLIGTAGAGVVPSYLVRVSGCELGGEGRASSFT